MILNDKYQKMLNAIDKHIDQQPDDLDRINGVMSAIIIRQLIEIKQRLDEIEEKLK